VRDCHMPKIEQTIADVNVRSHTFKFIAPSATDGMKAPNACNVRVEGRDPAELKALHPEGSPPAMEVKHVVV